MSKRSSQARERVLQAAERLFTQRGYAGVTVQDIAKEANLHHASLYHHIKDGGKEQLYIEVMERNLRRHQQGIAEAIATGGTNLQAQLNAIAAWLLSQPPMDFVRMTHVDMPAIEAASASRIKNLAYAALLAPIEMVLYQAQARGEIGEINAGNIGGAIFSAIQGLHTVPGEYLVQSREQMAEEIIQVLLRGMQPE